MNERAQAYAVLGLDERASVAEVRRAYRRLLRRYHPDTRAEQDAGRPAAADLDRVVAAYGVARQAAAERAAREARRAGERGEPRTGPRVDVHVAVDPPPPEPPLRVGPTRWHGWR